MIKVIPINPNMPPMTNNSMMTKIAPTKNNKTDIILTSPLIKNPKNKTKSDNTAIIPAKLTLLEYSWYKKPTNMMQVKINDNNGLVMIFEKLDIQLVDKIELKSICIALK